MVDAPSRNPRTNDVLSSSSQTLVRVYVAILCSFRPVKIQVKVQRGRNLVNTQTWTKQDPYVQMFLMPSEEPKVSEWVIALAEL